MAEIIDLGVIFDTSAIDRGADAWDRLGESTERAEKSVVGVGQASRTSGRASQGAFYNLFRAVQPLAPAIEKMTAEIIQLRQTMGGMDADVSDTVDEFRKLERVDLTNLQRQFSTTRGSVISIGTEAAAAAASMQSMTTQTSAASAAASKGAAAMGTLGAAAAAGVAAATAAAAIGMTAAAQKVVSAMAEVREIIARDFVLEIDDNKLAGQVLRVQQSYQSFLDTVTETQTLFDQMDFAKNFIGLEEAARRARSVLESYSRTDIEIIDFGGAIDELDRYIAKVKESGEGLTRLQREHLETAERFAQQMRTVMGKAPQETARMAADARQVVAESDSLMGRMIIQWERFQRVGREAFAGVRDRAVSALSSLQQRAESITSGIRRVVGGIFAPIEKAAEQVQKSIQRIGLDVYFNRWMTSMRRRAGEVARYVSTTFRDLSDRIRTSITPIRGLIASLGVGLSFGAWIRTVDEAQQTLQGLQSTLRSTGNVVGYTRDELVAMSETMQAATTYSAQQVQSTQVLLLTFNQIARDTFPRATQAALDMSARFGGDLRSATIQLGKALQSPLQGISALTEVGVTFTEQQKEQVKAMLEVGNIAGAQNLILGELENQVKGAASAARDTLGGSVKALSANFSDLVVAMSESSGGTSTLRGAFEGLNNVVNWAKDNIPIATGVVMGFATALGVAAVGATIAWIAALGPLGLAIAGISAGLGLAGGAIGTYLGYVDEMIESNNDLALATISTTDKIRAGFSALFDRVIQQAKAWAAALWAIFENWAMDIINIFGTVSRAAEKLFQLDWSGARDIIANEMSFSFSDGIDAAQQAYNEKMEGFDYETLIKKKLSQIDPIGEVGARLRAGEIPQGTRPPPPKPPTTGGGGTDPADTLRQLQAEMEAARRLSETYAGVLDAKIRIGEVKIQLTRNTADRAALEAEMVSLEKVARASEDLQRQLELENKLRAIKADKGTAMYRLQEQAIRQEHAYREAIRQTQQEIEAVDELSRIKQRAEAATVQAGAYEMVARIAETVVANVDAQSTAVAAARHEAEQMVEEYQQMVRIQELGIDRESKFYQTAVDTLNAIEAKRKEQERYNRVIEASESIQQHQREAEEIRQIAEAYAISTRAGDEMTRQVEAENYVRGLNLHLLGAQGIALEEHARKAAQSRQESERYRDFVDNSRGAMDEYRDSLNSAADQHRAFSDLAGSAFQGVEDQLVSLATTGKANFADLANSLMADMMRMIIRATLLRAVMSFINPGAGALPGGSGTDIIPMASGGIIRRPTIIPAASGTVLAGEAGDEGIFPLARNAQGKLGVIASGGGGDNYNMSVTIQAADGQSDQDTERMARVAQRSFDRWIDGRISHHKRHRGLLAPEGIRG